ncbi:Acyl-ACP thioesterase [Desulfonatronum thiosulfatophilum]|uniref:Acyl-ACP thioesterase n=1 Tax=Desulfonatronum thiosulfatophilum TaxID=617002 RepID=A0A1G6C2R4_9BACT|nr:acyl-ACP thioesterase domain-containing protein [Desulfonatronum thiosulfatophilum]SDB27151.1 Acyl-ACP thioesterase [Desulfonatronum thiosulfatophilum]
MSQSVWRESFRVRSNETDIHGLARLDGLFGYFQEAAGHHARVLGVGRKSLEDQGCFWVLSRCWMQIHQYPAWGQELVVRTWPQGVERLFALRHFRFLTEDGQEFGSGISAWLILDQEKHRPMRPGPFLDGIVLPEEPLVNGDVLVKLGSISDSEELRHVSAAYSDLDVNRHVNNAAYVRWTLDSFDLEQHSRRQIESIRIDYLSETLPGESISVRGREEAAGRQDIFGLRSTTAQPVFQARITWRDRMP